MKEAAKLAESTAVLLNVSEFQSIDDATSALTSTLQAFGYAAEDSMHVVDIMNEIGNNYAISSDGVATALQDSASSLMAANNSYQEAVALIASANRVVQDPNSVGAALRTISLRLRGTSTKELEEAGEDTEGVVTSKSKLRTKVQGYTGIDILTDSGAYKSTYDILLEISKVWDDLTDQDRAGLLELIAGKTRSNTAAAILSNTKDLEAAFKSAQEAEGSALRENEKYLDSIQGRIDLFNNSVQTMWNNALDSEVVKGFVNIGTQLVKWVDSFGLIKTLITAIGAFVIQKHFNGNLFEGLFGGISAESVSSAKTHLQVLKTEYEKAQAAFDANHSKDNEKYLNRAKNKYEQYKNQVAPQIEEYDELENKILSLKESRQSLSDEFDTAIIRQDKELPLIDQEIEGVQNKLEIAKQQLKEAKAADWDYYKRLGSKTPAKDRDNRINEKAQEVKAYEESLVKLQDTKKQIESAPDALGEQINNLDGEIHNLEESLNNIGITGPTAFQKIKTGAISAGKAVWKFGKEMLTSMATMYVITTILELFTKFGHMLEDWVDSWIETPEEAQDKFEELNEELSGIKSEINSLNSELETTQERIDELMSQGSLSFTEQEELDNLRAENAELERKIKLNKTLEESKQKSVNSAAVNATDKYMAGTSFTSDISRTEKQETWKENGETFGKVAGGIIGATLIALGVLGEAVTFGTSTGLIVLGGSMMAGGAIGGAMGSGLAGVAYDSEESVGEAMDNMLANRAKLQKAQNDAMAKDDAEAYNEATQALATYDEQMSKHISQIQANYNAMDWSTATEEERKRMQEYADWLDKYSISMGATGAKSNAIDRIFGKEADANLKAIKKEIEDIVKAESWDGQLDLSETFDDEFIARLHKMGIYVYEVENYFKDMAETEKEAAKVSLYDVVTDINKITDGLESLKSAFDEVIEGSTVSAKTLTELNEVFGTLGDSWDNYVNIMFSGVASTKEMQEATEELAKAFIDSKILTGEAISEYERMAYIIQLRNLGVVNAEEYVDDKIQENAYKAIQNSAAYNEKELEKHFGTLSNKAKENLDIKGKGFDELSSEELEKIAEYYNMSKEINAETAQNIADEYGIEIENLTEVIDLLEKKEQAEKKVADAKKSQNEYDEWINGDGGYKQTLEKIKEIQDKYEEIDVSTLSYSSFMGMYSYKDKDGNLNWVQMAEEEYKEIKAVYKRLEKLKNSEEGKKWLNEDGTLKAEVEAEFKAAYEAAQNGVEELQNQIETELTLDVKLKLELQEKSKLVDDIQSIYNTLMDAAQEYNENGGYVNVDTLQTLLELEPKYLAMLYDENGQLNLNKDAILNVARARVEDMGVQSALNLIEQASVAIENGKIDILKQLTETTYDQADANWELVRSNLAILKTKMEGANLDPTNPLYGQLGGMYEAVEGQVNSIQKLTLSASRNIGKSLRSGSGGSKDDDRLANIQKKYEGKINNLENQKTWLENEVAREEEIGAGVSKAYYEEQIKLNDKLSEQYEKQRTDLINLRKVYPEGSEKWYEVTEAIWEMDHAIQELTTDSIKASKSIIDLYTEAFEKIGEAFSDKSNISEKRIESMENYAELLDLRGSTATKGLFDAMISEYDTQLATKWEQFYAQQDIYNGLVATRDQYTPDSDDWVYYNQKVIKAHASLMDVKTEIQGIEIAQEQKREEFKELATQRWDDVRAAYENRDKYYQNQIALNDKYIEKLETLGINVPDEAYEAQIESLEAAKDSKWEDYLQARSQMGDYELIYGADSQEYIDKYNEVIELHQEALDYENQILDKQQQIFDNQIDRFNQVIDRITNATQRMQNISSLLEREDVATEDGEWTAEGLTRLGMAYQQMEYYKQSADEIAEKMEDVEKAYKRGEISEKKYYETMQELEGQQWDMINSYEDMKDNIVDLNEARIDMIEEGLDKEIEAYQELIDLKKEELDAERDLYEFKKDIEKQTKDIASLERRIASMSGSTDASTMAERTKLEAQLREAREGLDDTYYGHAMDSQSNALDDELDAYTKNAENYIESLRESIKDTDLLIEETFTKVLQGSSTVLENIYALSEQYKFPIDDNLTDPWENATQESLNFEIYAKGHIDGIYSYVEGMKGKLAKSLGDPYTERSTDADGNPLYEFSKYAAKQIDNVIEDAEGEQGRMKSALDGGFNEAKSSIQGWGEAAGTAVDNVIAKFTDPQNGLLAALSETTERAKAAKAAIDNMPDYDGGYTASTSNSGGVNNGGGSGVKSGTSVSALQEVLNTVFGAGLTVDGKYGPSTKSAVSAAQKKMGISADGYYGSSTRDALIKYVDQQIKSMQNSAWNSSYMSQGIQRYQEIKKKIPAAIYAKGTMGTTHDQLAITDESWIGEEITLAAGKNGQLQYLKKGSAVMPADISANLVEWGKLNPNMMNVGGGANLAMISNAVNKPELNFSFDSLVHVDNCSQDTLKDLEKMVDTKITQFNKQLNQSLRKFK